MSAAAAPPLFLRILFFLALLVALGALIAELFFPKPQPLLQAFHAQAPDPLYAMPDATEITHVPWRKEAYFSALLPLVIYENKRVAWQREQLHLAREALRAGIELTAQDIKLVEEILDFYQLAWPEDDQAWQRVFKRVAPVPYDLVLMQGAKESAWGTSRFALQGNNLFGEWCFTPNCGLVPERRTPDMQHEVRVFSSVQASVRSYLRNINTHRAYRGLRQVRQELIEQGLEPRGKDLAPGLIHYSERGQAYVNEMISLLRSNQLDMKQALENYYRTHSEGE